MAAALVVVPAAIAWACTPSGFGTPAAPAADDTSGGAPPSSAPEPAPQAQSPATPTQPAEPTTPAGSGSASGTTSGVMATKGDTPGAGGGGGNGGGPGSPNVVTQPQAPSTGNTAPAAGNTLVAGTVAATADTGAKAAAPKRAGSSDEAPAPAAPRVSARSATDDPWSGFAAPATSPLSAAEATAGGLSDGPGSGIVLGLAILGVGIAGLTGAFLVTRTARRRADID